MIAVVRSLLRWFRGKPKAPRIEVIIDPERIEAARRTARVFDPLSQEALSNTFIVSRRAIKGIDAQDAARRLKATIDDASCSWTIRQTAADYLMLVDAPAGEAAMLRLLREAPGDWAQLSFGSRIAEPERAPLRNTQLIDEIGRLLREVDTGWIVRSCASFSFASFESMLYDALESSGADKRAEILYWLTARFPCERALEAVITLLPALESVPCAHDRALTALTAFLQCGDEALRRRASDTLATEVLKAIDAERKFFDFPQMTAAETLESGVGPRVLELAAAAQTRAAYRLKNAGYACARRLEGEAGLQRTLSDLGEPATAKLAAIAIQHNYADTGDPRLVKALTTAISGETRESVLTAMAKALLHVGGESADAALRSVLASLPEDLRHDIQSMMMERRPHLLVAELAQAGILSIEEPGAFVNELRAAREADECADVPLTLIDILSHAGVAIRFDFESTMIPPDYDDLVAQFGQAGAGEFRPECCQQEGDDRHGPQFVSFIHGGRLYRFWTSPAGDWYDVESVVNACNQALADCGSPRRFHMTTADTEAEAVCVTVEQKDALARSFHVDWAM